MVGNFFAQNAQFLKSIKFKIYTFSANSSSGDVECILTTMRKSFPEMPTVLCSSSENDSEEILFKENNNPEKGRLDTKIVVLSTCNNFSPKKFKHTTQSQKLKKVFAEKITIHQKVSPHT